ncbi:MAG: glycoside hydrolase N-terminal domain-containing protein [Clostridia bacterium]|nr:glycoside hydrolase N-terminal domain-containing protein [Clostridia bacterium]
MKKDSIVLFEKSEAKCWEESFLLGNGTLGASVFGGTANERIVLNHDTLWSGYPGHNENRIGAKESLDKAKALIREKKYAQADKEIALNFSSYAVDCYLSMGELKLNYIGDNTPVSEYKRTLDLSKAVAECEYKKGGIKYSTHSYVSHPQGAFIWRTDCEGGKFNLDIGLECQLYSKVYADGNRLVLEGECPVNSEQNIWYKDRVTLYFDEPEKRGMRFMCALAALTDGTIDNKGVYLSVNNATYVEIRLVAETSFNGYEKHPFLEGKPYAENCKKALEKALVGDEKDILAAHIADNKRYFSRVSLDIGSSNKSRTPTSVRLARYEKGEEDKALPALLFNYGRYLTVAGSRKGSQAMNLQGIWNPHFFAPWQSNYTVNINTQMNYFPTLAIGLPEMYQPLIDLIKGVSKMGVETAKQYYGVDGWVCHHNTDLWRSTQPVAGSAQWLFWNACGAWLCHHLYEYYEYTLDKDYLRKTAYPIMRESARFYLSQLEDSEDGYRIIFPSTSPENRFSSEDGISAVSETTEMTMACVRELFGNLVSVYNELGENDEVLDLVKREIPRLRPTQIGSDGRVLEWYGEMTETEVRHRHASHLYGLHPGNEISPLKTPKLAEAARKTLAVRGDDGTGWSLAWKCNFYARLFDGDRALKLIKDQLRVCKLHNEFVYTGGGGSYPNLMCAHPPFQIDGNFGVVSGIAEMLVQSDADSIHIIPALPSEWNNMNVRGLRAKGKRKVSIKVENGALTECVIYGAPFKKILVAGKDMTDAFTVTDKKSFIK